MAAEAVATKKLLKDTAERLPCLFSNLPSTPTGSESMRSFRPIVSRPLQICVTGSAATFRRDPINDLIGIHDVASLAVDAVGSSDCKPGRPVVVGFHAVDRGRTEILARVSILLSTTGVTQIGIENHEVNRLIFFVRGARVVDVGQLVER